MKIIARTLAILAAALVVVGVAFALNHSGSATASAQRDMPPEFAQAASTSTDGSSTSTSAARPQRGPGGDHNESASMFGLVEVLKNLVIVGVITAVVVGIKRLFTRRSPRSGGPQPQAPPA